MALSSSRKLLPSPFLLCQQQNLRTSFVRTQTLYTCALSKAVKHQSRHIHLDVRCRFKVTHRLSQTNESLHFKANQRIWRHLEYSSPEVNPRIITRAVKNVDPKELSSSISISWSDGTKSVYPFVYLRDCCTCQLCYHADANQRLGDIFDVMDVSHDNLVNLESVSLVNEGKDIDIVWEDGHESSFNAEWLWERRLPGEISEKEEEKCFPKHLWGNEILQTLPETDFNELMTNDMTTFFFLNCLKQVGFVLIKNSPLQPNVLQDISKRLNIHVRRTHYGELFQVKSAPNPNSIAYTSEYIPLHVDLAYYKYHPGVQFLHCIEQTKDPEGGWSLLADGFYIADRIKKTKPETYEFLTKRKFIFKDVGEDIYGTFKKELARPIIEVDENGEPCHIAFNNFTRSSFFKESAKKVQEAYRAYYEWEKELRKPENSIRFKLMPGDILCMDNIRLLHGRTGFDLQASPRWLQGCYFDWDEINSSFAVFNDLIARSEASTS